MGRDLSDLYVVLCNFRLKGELINRRGVADGGKGIKSEKTREGHYREGYAGLLREERKMG